MTENKYRSEQVQRVLRVMLALRGNNYQGMTVSEVAVAAECSVAHALRDLENLRIAGIAERLHSDDKKWIYGPEIPRTATSFMNHISRMRRDVEDYINRYTREI